MRLVFVGRKHLKCIFFCEKKKLWFFWLYGFTNRFDFLSSLLLLLHNKQRLFYLVQKILGYVHAQNCIILKTILSTSLMWKKDLKLHRNLSLTITDKTSYDIPTLPDVTILVKFLFSATKIASFHPPLTKFLHNFQAWRWWLWPKWDLSLPILADTHAISTTVTILMDNTYCKDRQT